MWLISDPEYEKLKSMNVALPSNLDLSQLRTKFMQDKLMNQIQDDNMWNRLNDRIKPMLQAQQTATIPPPSRPRPRPAQSVRFFSVGSPSFSSQPSSQASSDQSFRTAKPPSPSVFSMIDEDERREQDLEQQQQPDLGRQEPEEESLSIIKEESPAKFRGKVERLFKMLNSLPEVQITSRWVYVGDKKSEERSAMVLIDLVKPNKKFKYKSNLVWLLDVLAKLPGITEVVSNKEAQKEIKNRIRPGSQKRRSKSSKSSKGSNDDDEDEFYEPQSSVKGSGKSKGRKIIKWHSLFR